MNINTFCGSCGQKRKANERCKNCQRQRNKAKDPIMKKEFNSSKWKKFRLSVIKRDIGHCQRCLVKDNWITADNLQVHHIKPRVKYPELMYVESNCVTLCQSCNTQLGTAEELDFEWTVPKVYVPVL